MNTLTTILLRPIYSLLLGRAAAGYRSRPDAKSATRLACALIRAGKANEAYSTIAAARRNFPESEATRKAYELIRVQYAKSLLDKTMHALKHDRRLENFVRAADLMRTIGQTEKALSILDQIKSEHANNWAFEFAIGQIYFSRFREAHHPADLTESLNHLRAARQQNPRNYKVLSFMALTCAHAALYDEAMDCITAILEVLPTDPKALSLKAQVERARGSARLRPPAVQHHAHHEGAPVQTAAEGEWSSDGGKRLVDRLLELPEVVAALAFTDAGDLIASQRRESQHFDFGHCTESAWNMIKGCKADSEHIGIGQLQSCMLSGPHWQILIRTIEETNVVAYMEAEHVPPSVEKLFDQLTASVQ